MNVFITAVLCRVALHLVIALADTEPIFQPKLADDDRDLFCQFYGAIVDVVDELVGGQHIMRHIYNLLVAPPAVITIGTRETTNQKVPIYTKFSARAFQYESISYKRVRAGLKMLENGKPLYDLTNINTNLNLNDFEHEHWDDFAYSIVEAISLVPGFFFSPFGLLIYRYDINFFVSLGFYIFKKIMQTFETLLLTWFKVDNQIAEVIFNLVEIVVQEIFIEYVLEIFPYGKLLNATNLAFRRYKILYDEVLIEMFKKPMESALFHMNADVETMVKHEMKDEKPFIPGPTPEAERRILKQREGRVPKKTERRVVYGDVYGDAAPVFAQQVIRIVNGKLVPFFRKQEKVSGVSQLIEVFRNSSEEVLKNPTNLFIGPLTLEDNPVLDIPITAFYYFKTQAFWRLVDCKQVNNCKRTGSVPDQSYKCIVNSNDPIVLNASRRFRTMYTLVDLVEEIDLVEEKFKICRDAEKKRVIPEVGYFCVTYFCKSHW